MTTQNKVFISYKHHGPNGEILLDYHMAKDVYIELKKIGIEAFFSEESIIKTGQSNYKKLIDDRLDEASLLILVSTNIDHCNSNWVRYEWDSFYNDLLSEKKQGCLISYLDTTDINDYPRTIRSNQSFKKDENGLSQLIIFVKNFFRNTRTATPVQKGSSYGYEIGDERRRLAIQAKVESKKDFYYIDSLLPSRDTIYNVLDVGCSMGSVTFSVFSKFGDRVQVLGVDKFQSCIDGFRENCPSNMFAEVLDFDNEYQEKLKSYMKKYNIDSFDLIYCSLSLHHMADSASVLKDMYKFLRNGGYIYIRTCDDGLKISYPDPENLVKEIIDATANVSQVSDRYHGRKIFTQLQKAKFEDIKIETFLIDTTNKDLRERGTLFETAFSWRKNYFIRQVNNSHDDDENIKRLMNNYNAITSKLDKIDDLFYNLSYYFGYYVTIAIAKKSEEYY